MAEILEEFDFSLHQRGSPGKYPWSEWMDGQIWKVKRGVDFEVSTLSFAGFLRGHAKRKGKTVKAARFGDYVVFQFALDGPAERAEESRLDTRGGKR